MEKKVDLVGGGWFCSVMYDIGAYYGNHLKVIQLLESVKNGPVKIADEIIEYLHTNLRVKVIDLMVKLFTYIKLKHKDEAAIGREAAYKKVAEWYLDEIPDAVIELDDDFETYVARDFQDGYNYGYENPEDEIYIKDIDLFTI